MKKEQYLSVAVEIEMDGEMAHLNGNDCENYGVDADAVIDKYIDKFNEQCDARLLASEKLIIREFLKWRIG